VSGGLDSTLVGILLKEEGIIQFPLFIDYAQRARNKEWATCQLVHEKYGLPKPVRMDLSGFGVVIASGLTRTNLDIKKDAFTPGRNFLFIIAGAAYAYQVKANAISLGLLSEKFSLFPDQRESFIQKAELAIEAALGRHIKIVTPLSSFTKADVVALANKKGISGTYSCHTGNDIPCGKCISCLEYLTPKEE
jgi:7-cyano-7-deazaguanine synthase